MTKLTKNVLSISGGKDSTAMLLIAIEQAVEFTAVFADTGNEHPAVYDYIDYLENTLNIKIRRLKADFSAQIKHKRYVVAAKWRKDGISIEIINTALAVLKPTGNPFLDLAIYMGRFPSPLRRFCTTLLKQKPIEESVYMPLLMDGYNVESWIGVRADESAKRAAYPIREAHHDKNLAGVHLYRPLINWTAQDVFDTHKKHNIKPNPLYLKGFSRVGCMPCINARKGEINQIARRFPKEFTRLKKWEAIISQASKSGVATFFGANKVPNQTVSPIEEVVKWSKTSRGGKEFDLFLTGNINEAVCESAYGLCDQEGVQHD